MHVVALKRAVICSHNHRVRLAAETVQSTALPLQCINHVHGRDSLALGVLTVGDGITNDILQEDFQYTACLFVDETRDPLDSTPSC